MGISRQLSALLNPSASGRSNPSFALEYNAAALPSPSVPSPVYSHSPLLSVRVFFQNVQPLRILPGRSVSDDTVMNKSALAQGPEVIDIHKRVVAIAQEKKVVDGHNCASIRRSLKPTSTIRPTVVCWATGVRVLTRAMKRIAAIAGDVGVLSIRRSVSVGVPKRLPRPP